MSTDPKFWSDEFEIVDDPDFVVTLEDNLDESCIDETLGYDGGRRMTPWQQLEDRLGERQLRAELGEWDYWDEYLVAH